MTNTEYRRKARANLEDSYIKRILRVKRGFMAKDCTPKIIKETRKNIKNLRKKKKLTKKLLADGKYKCSRCFVIKTLDMFYKDSSKKIGFSRACKKCVSVSTPYKEANKKYNKRIKEGLEDVYIKGLLCNNGVKLEDVTNEMIINKRKSIQEDRDKAIFKDMLLRKNKRICRICNKPKKNYTFIKKSRLTNVCLDCYKPMMKASEENKRIWLRKYNIKNADKLRERRKLYALNNPEIIKKCREIAKIKLREKSLNSINTCNDCKIELGLRKDTKGMVVCNNCEIIRKEALKKKLKEKFKNLSKEKKEELNNKQKKKLKKLRDNLDDSYIRNQLCSRSILKSKDIPQEMVEAKRQIIKLKRIIKEQE